MSVFVKQGIITFVIFALFLLHSFQVCCSKKKWVVNQGTSWSDYDTNRSAYSDNMATIKSDSASNREANALFRDKADFIRGLNPHSKRFAAIDFEALYAIENFFWRTWNGISLELGALDGSVGNGEAASQTGDFNDFAWHRIIIDANPKYRETMKKYSPESFSVNAAICMPQDHSFVLNSTHIGDNQGGAPSIDSNTSKHHVHFLESDNSPTSGVIEFMSLPFIYKFHKFLLLDKVSSAIDSGQIKLDTDDLELRDVLKPNLESIQSTSSQRFTISKVSCLPLQRIIDAVGVRHINFFVLDVEGGELSVLSTIDWNKTVFDVLCIETDPENRRKGYSEEIQRFMLGKGYEHVHDDRRNAWFARSDFKPMRRPQCCPKPDTRFFPPPIEDVVELRDNVTVRKLLSPTH